VKNDNQLTVLKKEELNTTTETPENDFPYRSVPNENVCQNSIKK
jgi:hypothetical protein